MIQLNYLISYKMGCCQNSEASVSIEHRDLKPLAMQTLQQQKLTVYGSYLDNDTRTIMMLLTLAGISAEFNQVDPLKDEQERAFFKKLNPAMTTPVVVLDRHFKVLGSTKVFVNYLVNQYPKVRDLCPNAELSAQYLNWFAAIFRPCARQMTEAHISQKKFGVTTETLSELDFFINTLLPQLEEMLGEHQCFC